MTYLKINKMKKFIIKLGTDWCGEDNSVAAIAPDEYTLDEIANELAYENFESYNHFEDICQELELNSDDMSPKDWETYYDNELNFYYYIIKEVKTPEDLLYFNELELVYESDEDDLYEGDEDEVWEDIDENE